LSHQKENKCGWDKGKQRHDYEKEMIPANL
jgi:hypothetical protein